MKNLIFIMLFLPVTILAQNVGINTSTPDNSAILDAQSTNKGILLPRMTNFDKFNITSPADGLILYQTDNDTGFFYFQSNLPYYIGNENNNEWIKSGNYVITHFNDSIRIGTTNNYNRLNVNGYVAAGNYYVEIPLYKSTEITLNNSDFQDIADVETGVIPSLFATNGNIQVKVIIRSTDKNGINHFRLRVHNGTTELFPVLDTDSWTWAYTQTGSVVTSPWKDWNGGNSAWEVHLQEKSDNTGDYVKINAAYIVIRPKQ